MSRSTIFSLVVLVTGSVLLLLSGNAQAAWMEDFSSYPAGLLTSTPWDQGSVDDLGENQIVTAAAGYLGSQGLVAVGDHYGSLGNAWRIADAGADVLTARLYSDNALSPNNSRYYIGFYNSPSVDGANHATDDYLAIYLTSFVDGAGNFLSFEYSNFDGPEGDFIPPVAPDDRGDDNSCCSSGILGETWYDVRITLNGDDTATGEYRVSAAGDSGAWTLVGDGGTGSAGDGMINIVDPAGFNPNFVGFRGGFNARLDDINVNGVGGAPATEFTWDTTNLGDWARSNNWTFSTGSTPSFNIRANGPDHTAIFGENISGPTTVSTQDAVTVNRIEFNNAAHSVAVAGLGSVNVAATETPCLSCPSVSVTGTHQFQTVVNLLAETTMNVGSGSTLSFNNALNLTGNTLIKTGDGTVAINNHLTTAGGNVDVQQGTISGNGTIGGDVTNSGGTASPGNSPGMLTVDGNYNQASGGTLAIEIGGNEAGVDYDVLQVLGDASLAGTLDISLIDGFTPGGSDTFTVLTAGGELTDLGLTLGGSDAALFTMSIDTTNDWIMLMTVGGGGGVTGDYNSNGIVDAADYTVWRDSLGTNNLLPNDNIGGSVTEAHYLQWKNNFGNTAGSGSSSGAAVPEPVSACLLIVAWGGISLVSRRREGAM